MSNTPFWWLYIDSVGTVLLTVMWVRFFDRRK